MSMTYWPHQERIHGLCQAQWAKKCKRWCVVAPCGAGKTLMMRRIIEGAVANGLRVAIYSCRIQNTKQLMESLEKAGIEYGTVAAAFRRTANPSAQVQVCQLQTVAGRSGAVPDADIVIIDEAHQQANNQAKTVLDAHEKSGCRAVIGYTATPVNLSGMYEEILPGPRFEELLQCKAHLPAKVFIPEIPMCIARNDRDIMKIQSSGEISSAIDAQINDIETIYGNVYNEWRRLNPDGLPAVLFAPDVKSAVGYVYKFREKGVCTASIDGDRVVVCRPDMSGVDEYDSTIQARQDVIEGSRDGIYKIVHNRFVLRESVDMPWLYHCIICSTMGGLSTYLQSVGRVLRYWPHYDHVIIQDHSGSTDRHGFPFEDREWELGDTNNSMQKKLRNKRKGTPGDGAEPIVCPKCGAARSGGGKCFECGHMHKRSVRFVRDIGGKLIEKKVGRLTKQAKKKDADYFLRQALYQFKNSSSAGTIKQAYHIAKKKARIEGVKEFVPRGVNLPQAERDWSCSVKDYYRDRRI